MITMLTTEEWIEELKSITVLELSERIKALEETFGVSATAVVPISQTVVPGEAEVEEQTAFDVVITGLKDSSAKIQVIKALRPITNLGLKEAKALVDPAAAGEAVTIKEGLSRDEADNIKGQLEEAGAITEVR